MTEFKNRALNANAWPFAEARELLKRVGDKAPEKGHVLFETGYGPSGLPHIGTFGEVTRTSMVRHAFSLLSDLPTKLIAFSDDMDGLRKVPDNIPNPGPKPVKKGPMKIYAFPLGSDGKVAGKRKTLVDFGDEDGCDGMTVDEQGNVYLTVRSVRRPGVMAIDPKGKEVAFIPTGPPNQAGAESPVGLPSNVEFGIGEEAQVLYVTVDKSLYRIPLKVKGYHVQYAK